MSYLFLALFIGISFLQLLFCWIGNEKGRVITKPMLLSTLTLYYVTAANPVSLLLLFALLTSLLGDILLIPPGEKWLVTGGASFLLSHILFITLYLPRIRFGEIPWALACLAGVAYLAVALFVILRIKRTTPKQMLVPLYLYLIANTVMNVFALMQLMTLRNLGAVLAFIGAICFFASDCILFLLRYYEHKERLVKPAFLVMLTYLAGEFLITQGMLLL